MEKININLDRYKQSKKSPAYYWQQLALEALEYLDGANKKKSVIFKAFRNKEQQATAILRYMQSKNKKHVLYFLKCLK
jgi:hypothetical protein